MSQETDQPHHFDTLAIRSGHERTNEQEHSEAIFATSSFIFHSAEEAAKKFNGDIPGSTYSRMTNPTISYLQNRLASLESAEACIATASGMAANLSICLGLLKQGDHILCGNSLFGTNTAMFEDFFSKFGVSSTAVQLSDTKAWENAIQANTKLLFVESPTNPMTEIGDIRALADLAHAHGAYLVVDNCICTPALMNPIKLGADLVMHSGTKFLDGQGRCLGGAVLGSETLITEKIFPVLRSCGTCISPFNAWVIHKGLETLNLRMERHCQNAQIVAEFLAEHPKVKAVNYPGLPIHPQHDLAKSQQSGFGAVMSFELADQTAAWNFIDAVKVFSITGNFGDVKSTTTHPATTTHARLSDQQRSASGIKDGLVRVQVGLEAVADIIQDLDQALQAVTV